MAKFNPQKGPRPKGPALAKRIRAGRTASKSKSGSKGNAWRSYTGGGPIPD